MRKGVPDLFLPVSRHGFHGLFIEMKRRRGGVVNDRQRWWRDQLRAQGYRVEVCKGADEAIAVLFEYVS
jgi:hypothetical protein